MELEKYNLLSGQIIDAAIKVHKVMGPGLLESVYECCLCKELENRGIKYTKQAVIPLYYLGERLEKEFRVDVLVENSVIIEIKSVEFLLPVHASQLLAYLRLSEKKLGLLINFNVSILKDGIKRIVNKLY